MARGRYPDRVIRARRTLVGLVACVALLALAGIAQGATYDVADADSGQGNNDTCAPCRTIGAALRRAALNPGQDRVLLGVGTYRTGIVVIRDPAGLVFQGHGGRTALDGMIDVGLPAGLIYGGGSRIVQIFDMAVSNPTGVAIRSNRVDVDVGRASVYGSVNVVNAGGSLYQASVIADGCRPAFTVDVGDVGDAAHNLEVSDVFSSVWRSTVVGQPAVRYRGSANVFESMLVTRSWMLSGLAGCPRQNGQALWVGGQGIAQMFNSIAATADGASAAIVASDAVLFATLSTIVGPFDVGITAVNARVVSQGMAIDGPPIAVDATGGGNVPLGTFQLDYTFASGRARLGGFAVDLPTNRFATPLVTTYGMPQAGSPLLNAIPGDFRFETLDPAALTTSYNDVARPQPFVTGGPPAYEVGAVEIPASALTLALPLDFQGPGWLPGRVVGVQPEADLAGVGLPAPAGAPAAGSAAAPGVAPPAEAAAADAVVKVAPELVIVPPRRVVQGTTVVVRVKVPYRGRLTLRTYGARGGLVAVGRGRPVVKGWRKVKLTIGPNTRLGTLRIVATHVRPQTRALLTAANVTRVVKG